LLSSALQLLSKSFTGFSFLSGTRGSVPSTLMALIPVALFYLLAVFILCDATAHLQHSSGKAREGSLGPDNLIQNTSFDPSLLMNHVQTGRVLESSLTKKRKPRILDYKLNNPKDESLSKRAGTPFGPLIKLDNCLFCPQKAKTEGKLTVTKDFMAEDMIGLMNYFATYGSCLFCELTGTMIIPAIF
jgi:hypothetical protein